MSATKNGLIAVYVLSHFNVLSQQIKNVFFSLEAKFPMKLKLLACFWEALEPFHAIKNPLSLSGGMMEARSHAFDRVTLGKNSFLYLLKEMETVYFYLFIKNLLFDIIFMNSA